MSGGRALRSPWQNDRDCNKDKLGAWDVYQETAPRTKSVELTSFCRSINDRMFAQLVWPRQLYPCFHPSAYKNCYSGGKNEFSAASFCSFSHYVTVVYD